MKMSIALKCICLILPKFLKSMWIYCNQNSSHANYCNVVHFQTSCCFFSHRDFTVVPILVGSLSPERETHYGRLLSKYLADPNNCFVVSSDFCHWGQRFRYTHYDKACGEIFQSIQRLDREVLLFFPFSFTNINCAINEQGMSIIETLDTAGFTEYLKKYGNTICGRHPIGVLLNVKNLVLSD